MRSSRAMAGLVMALAAVGCGRSSLTDDLGLAVPGDDGGESFDSSSLLPTDDVSVSPPQDVTVLPRQDAPFAHPPPPGFDGTAPLRVDAFFSPPPFVFDSTAGMCPANCMADSDCQNGCPPAANGGANCCDTTSGICFVSTSLTCPVIDGGTPALDVDVFVPTGGCGFATCSGCCDENGGCHSGHDNSGCGGQGELCKTCSQICVDGVCLNLSNNCSPSNCTGCCLGTDVCTDGLHAGACGSGGMQCESCNPATSGGKCVTKAGGTGGACVTPPNAGCGPSTCPMGCCVGNLCVVGTQDIACGSGGVLCQDCTQTGHTCLGRTCSF